MGVVWNRELKKLMLAVAAVFFFSCFLVNLCVGTYANHVRMEYNRLLASLFGNVMTAYPEVAEEEIIRILNDREKETEGAKILAQYGVLEEYGADTFAIQEQELSFMRVGANLILVFVYCLIVCLLFAYLKRRQKNISHLADYMVTLNRDGYQLNIEENAEDELSGLRNELYKLTVLLKEQANRAVQQKQILADTMVNISHQLKTPLTSVTVLADNLFEDPDMEKETRQHFVAEITRQITGMSWLITVMLKRARLDAGVVELEKRRLRIKELIEEVIQRLELATEWKNLTVSVDIPDNAGLVADFRWMSEALMNIVKNALEHSSMGGTVEISGEENEIYSEIVIRDHGTGITKEEQNKLFQRFYNGSSVREDSVGIGLALAKEIVEKHHGSISVDSCPGKGTTFILRFIGQ